MKSAWIGTLRGVARFLAGVVEWAEDINARVAELERERKHPQGAETMPAQSGPSAIRVPDVTPMSEGPREEIPASPRHVARAEPMTLDPKTWPPREVEAGGNAHHPPKNVVYEKDDLDDAIVLLVYGSCRNLDEWRARRRDILIHRRLATYQVAGIVAAAVHAGRLRKFFQPVTPSNADIAASPVNVSPEPARIVSLEGTSVDRGTPTEVVLPEVASPSKSADADPGAKAVIDPPKSEPTRSGSRVKRRSGAEPRLAPASSKPASHGLPDGYDPAKPSEWPCREATSGFVDRAPEETEREMTPADRSLIVEAFRVADKDRAWPRTWNVVGARLRYTRKQISDAIADARSNGSLPRLGT